MATERDRKRERTLTTLSTPVTILLVGAVCVWIAAIAIGQGRPARWASVVAASVTVVAVVYLASLSIHIARRRVTLASTQRGRGEIDPLFVDRLTGLPARYWFEQTVSSEFARRRRYRNRLSLVVLNVDHLRRLARTRGGATVDRVLVAIATVLRASIRESDHCARLSDNEFVALLSETPEKGAVVVAEKLRLAVEQNQVEPGLTSTVSVGVAEVTDADSLQTILRRGEAAAMTARRQGGNSVATATF